MANVTVRIASALIEEFLTAGTEIRRMRIIDGIPKGATLLTVRPESEHTFALEFAVEGEVLDRDVEIKIESFYP